MKKESVWRGLSVVLSTWAFWVILIYFAVPSLPGWATKNWLPTLFAENLGLEMAQAGPMSTITIAASSFVGVLLGGVLSDKWVLRNIRGRIYTGAIGLGLTIPALLLLGLGNGFISIVGAGFLFGVGFGMFDANNMPILCQFVSAKYRATAYGIMNMTGVFAGAVVTSLFGKWTDGGNLGLGFAILGGIVLLALGMQLCFLRPHTDNME
jgi:MFS family permease